MQNGGFSPCICGNLYGSGWRLSASIKAFFANIPNGRRCAFGWLAATMLGAAPEEGSKAGAALAAGERERVMKEQPEAQSIVFVIDDDVSVREALKSLFRSVGMRVEAFSSTAEFLKHRRPEATACLVLDIRMPGVSGLDFQVELAKAGIRIPVIFITGHGDIPMSVRAMKAGAVEFLTKPFREQDLLDAVQIGLEHDRAQRSLDKTIGEVRTNFETLTPREQEVIGFVTAGLMNKQIAAELSVSEVTVKVHRGNVMKKMGAHSIADLVRMADALGIQRAKR